MKITKEEEHYLVVDDFLPENDFKRILDYISTEQYQFVQTRSYSRAYRLSDGNPLEGKVYLSKHAQQLDGTVSYPSNTPMDLFFDKLDAFEKKKNIVGVVERDWRLYSAKPVAYQANTGLSWHDDFSDVTGGYTYFCHPYWDVQWAGELLISSTHISDIEKIAERQQFKHSNLYHKSIYKDEHINHAMQEHGCGIYVFPKPNRLVFLKAGYLHKVQKIGPEIGDRFRASIIGFFCNYSASLAEKS